MANFFLAVWYVPFRTALSFVKMRGGKQGQYLQVGMVGAKKVANYDDIHTPCMYTCKRDVMTPFSE